MSKTPKKFDASNVSYKARLKLVTRTLINMRSQKTGVSNASILLAGDPGVGKTSFIRFFARLTGTNLVTLEVPHLTEEHIINIPFIKFNPVTGKTKADAVGGTRKGQFDLVLSESNLYSTLKKSKKISDVKYLEAMYSSKPEYANVRKVFEALGGDRNTIPEPIHAVRERFTTILFLDEFFRKTSVSVRNMLRGILNRKLGLNNLPRYVYPIYATNINDDGIDSIPTNNQFNLIEMKSPDKNSWFDYVKDDAKENGIDLNDDIVNIFYDAVDEEHLSFRDPTADYYVSPRRWHQMLYYVNESIAKPVRNPDIISALLANVRAGFTNYKTGAVSGLYEEIASRICEHANKVNGTNLNPNDYLPSSRWREILHHQIVRKMRLGDSRKYIPVISGLPGIGKTQQMDHISKKLKVGLIYVDCSTLSYEDVMGTPLSQDEEGGDISIQFSDSKLYKLIEKMAKEVEPANTAKHGYKYIIFFDELNRTNTKTFNGLRKVILEKEFDNGKKLPDQSVVIAAINPTDDGGGVTELTSHMADVLDIISAAPNWQTSLEWMRSQNLGSELNYPELVPSITTVIETFANHFGDPASELNIEKQFTPNIGAGPIYISPREYSQILSEGALSIDLGIDSLLDEYDEEELNGDSPNIGAIDNELRFTLYEVFAGVMRSIFIKNGVESPAALEALHTWFMTEPLASPITELVSFKAQIDPIEDVVGNLIDDETPFAENSEVVAFLKNTDISMLSEHVTDILLKLNEKGQLLDRSYPYRVIDESGNLVTYEEMHGKLFDDGVDRELFPEKNSRGVALTDKEKKKADPEYGNLTLFSYVLNELCQAIKIHNLSNELLDMVRNVLVTIFIDGDNSELIDAVTATAQIWTSETAASKE